MITIQTRGDFNDPIEITDSTLRDYAKLMSMLDLDLSVKGKGFDGITILSCLINGIDTAHETIYRAGIVGCTDYALACIYWTVETAKTYEIL